MTTPRVEHREAETPLPEPKADAERRLRREKRWEDFTHRRDQIRAQLRRTHKWGKVASNNEAWARALKEFPPLPPEMLPEADEKPMKRAAWVAPSLASVTKRLKDLPVAETAAEIRAADLWVLNHPALSRDPGPHGIRYVVPDDFEGCPSRMAWNLLNMAVTEPAAFRKEVMSRLKSEKVATASEGGVSAAEDEGLDDLEAVLERAKGGA